MDKHDSDLEEPGELPDSDNDHMYDDIEDFDLGKEVEKLKTENSMLKDHITSLERDIEKLTKAIVTLKKVQENLEKNISSLYLTAKAEIDRKNRQIAELQRELDDFKFRRKRPAPGHPQFHQVKRARYEISEEQYGNWQHPHQSIGFNNGESDGSMTQFSTRKLKVDENRGSREEKYELLDNNEKRKRDNDQIGDRQDTPDSVEKTSNDPNRDREVENTQNREKDSNEQSSRQKQEEYERTRGYREDAYERHSSTQKRQRFNDETDDRHDTPDIEDRRSDIDSLRGRELENRLGDDRHYSRNRQEEFERTRGYRDRRYGEFDTERRDRNWHDHPKNRLGWAYHKEPDMYDDRGYRGGRDGIRDRHPRDRNFGRDRAKSRERTSNNERDRERSRDHRSERNRSRERRHKSRDAPKDETVSQEIKSTEEGELPENPNPEVARKEDPQSYVQVSKLVVRKKLKVVQKLEESMSRSPPKNIRNAKFSGTSTDSQSKTAISVQETESTDNKKILVLSNIVLSDGSDKKSETARSLTPEEPLSRKGSGEAEYSDDLSEIKKFLYSEGKKDKNKVSNRCSTESAMDVLNPLQIESKSTDRDNINSKVDSVKKITLDTYKVRLSNLKKPADSHTGIQTEPCKSLVTKEQIQKDLEAEGLIFRSKDTRPPPAGLKEGNTANESVGESKCNTNVAIKDNNEIGIESVRNCEANEDKNRKEASVGLLLLRDVTLEEKRKGDAIVGNKDGTCVEKDSNSNSVGDNKSEGQIAINEEHKASKDEESKTHRKSNKYSNKGQSNVQPEQANVIVINASSESRDTIRKDNVEENIAVKNQEKQINAESNRPKRGTRTSPRNRTTVKPPLSNNLKEKMKSLFNESMDASDINTGSQQEIKSTHNVADNQESNATETARSNTNLKTYDSQSDTKQDSCQEIKDNNNIEVDRNDNSCQKKNSKLANTANKRPVEVEEQKETTTLRTSTTKKVVEQNTSSKRHRSRSTSVKSESDKEAIKVKTNESYPDGRSDEKKTDTPDCLKGFDKLNKQIDDVVAASHTESNKVKKDLSEKAKPSKKKSVVEKNLETTSSAENCENDKTKQQNDVPSKQNVDRTTINTNDTSASHHVTVIEEKPVVVECKAILNDASANHSTTVPMKSTPENKKNAIKKRITPTPVARFNKPTNFEDMLKKCEPPVADKHEKNLLIEQNLHLTHEGDIPLLHIEESHIDGLPNEDLRNPDSSLMRLIDTMTLSNMECELPKIQDENNSKGEGSIVKTSSNDLSFENLMYKVSSSPIHVTSAKGVDVNVPGNVEGPRTTDASGAAFISENRSGTDTVSTTCKNRIGATEPSSAASPSENVNSTNNVSSTCTNTSGATGVSDTNETAGINVNVNKGSTVGATTKTPVKRKRRLVRMIISD